MDLRDISKWPDEDVLEALEEIDRGLSARNIEWIERFRDSFDEREELSTRQREVAEDILIQWSERHG